MNESKVPEWLLNASNRIIEHMNEDHSNSIVSTLNAQHGIKDKNAKMEELQVNGYFALSNQVGRPGGLWNLGVSPLTLKI